MELHIKMSHQLELAMIEFTGKSKLDFGAIEFIAHLLISLSVLLVIVALIGVFIFNSEIFSILIGVGGIGVAAGVVFGFLNRIIS